MNGRMGGEDLYLMKAMKRKNRMGSESAGSSGDDVWDDSALVEAYNRAVNNALERVLQNMPNIPPKFRNSINNTNLLKQWRVGDYCRCEFSEDHIYYEAIVIDIIHDMGMCIVKYVGYENEEKVYLSKLKPSKGEMARVMQMKQAAKEKHATSGPPHDKQPGSVNLPKPGKKNISTKPENAKGREFSSLREVNTEYPTASHMFKPQLMGVIPPPPPPQMFTQLDDNIHESDAMSAMLMSWYMSGYHTGYYQGLKAAKK